MRRGVPEFAKDQHRNPSNKDGPASEKVVQLGGGRQAVGKEDSLTPPATQPRRSGSPANIIVPLHETGQAVFADEDNPSTAGGSKLVRRENGWGATSLRTGHIKVEQLPPDYMFAGSDMLNIFSVDQSSPYYPLRDSLRTPNVRVMTVKVRDVAIEPLHYLPIEPSKRNAELLHFC